MKAKKIVKQILSGEADIKLSELVALGIAMDKIPMIAFTDKSEYLRAHKERSVIIKDRDYWKSRALSAELVMDLEMAKCDAVANHEYEKAVTIRDEERNARELHEKYKSQPPTNE